MEMPLSFYKTIYPLNEPLYERDRPLQVLCLGLSRSGTESLSKALEQLGYNDTYHGMQLIARRHSEIPQWYRLTRAKQTGNEASLSAAEFDKVLGQSTAVTDVPCCAFGPELMRAYPDARVVLNRRLDSQAWEKSIRATLIGRYDSWMSRVPMWFAHEIFWTSFLTLNVFNPLMVHPLVHSPDGMAREYERHTERLEAECQRLGRAYLIWGPENGWEPLCKFLDKPIPTETFPQGNTPADMVRFVKEVYQPRVDRARRNMIIFGVAVVGAASGMVWINFDVLRKVLFLE